MAQDNKYAVRGRLEYLEKTVGELRQDVTALASRPPVVGPAGKDGSNCQCRNGKDGKDGARGPQGIPGASIQGLPGASVKGDKGERGPSGPDTAEALAEARAVIASFRVELAALRATLQALIDADKRTGQYLEWLKERTKARVL